jgi:hypothetical protein
MTLSVPRRGRTLTATGFARRRGRFRAYPRTGGDCPDFAQSAEQNGTVPLSETVLG